MVIGLHQFRNHHLFQTATMNPNNLHGVFKAILNGLHERGEGGVLYVKGDECAYRFSSEFTNVQFRGALDKVIEDDEGVHFFVVEERDKQLHVLAYPKTRVWSECAGDDKNTSKNGSIVEIDPSNDEVHDACTTGNSGDNHTADSRA
jgi:hypothetical protein